MNKPITSRDTRQGSHPRLQELRKLLRTLRWAIERRITSK